MKLNKLRNRTITASVKLLDKAKHTPKASELFAEEVELISNKDGLALEEKLHLIREAFDQHVTDLIKEKTNA